MPSSDISGESLYLIQVATLCKGTAVTCGPDVGLVEITRSMREHDVSGLIVVDGNQRDRLREALRGVGAFLRMIREHFQLELIAR